jgi:uncharacterized protein (TIGR02246 family)
MRNLKRVHDAGITIAAATDAGNIGTQHASALYNEAKHMADSGLSPKQVLLTATRGGAAMMGRSHDLGTLAKGKLADVTLLGANPLQDIGAIGEIRAVVRDGRVYDAETILNEGSEQIVQRQVNAFNHHDAAIFAETYAADALMLRSEGTLRSRRKIEATYRNLFAQNPQLHSEVVERDVLGSVVVDRQRVTGFADGSTVEAKVTYEVRNGAIADARVEV